MSEPNRPFAFSQFVPGFDFLKNLGSGAAGAASPVPGLPGLSNWVAPTLKVEEVEKRIQELKTVQFWLDQNLNALKATIQALEVQKMTLSTLEGMNVRMDDLAKAFAPATAASAAPASSTASTSSAASTASPAPSFAAPPPAATAPGAAAAAPAPGVVDPLQWWGALTQQFEQIASSALREAASQQVPTAPKAGAARPVDAIKKRASPARGTGATAPKASQAASPRPPAKRPPAKRAAPKR